MILKFPQNKVNPSNIECDMLTENDTILLNLKFPKKFKEAIQKSDDVILCIEFQ